MDDLQLDKNSITYIIVDYITFCYTYSIIQNAVARALIASMHKAVTKLCH